MADGLNRSRLALSCAPDGGVVQILRDDFGVATGGTHLQEIVDTGSAGKAEAMLRALAERGVVAGWHLNVPGHAARPLYFAGAKSGDLLLILAAPGAGPVSELLDEIPSADAATSRALRALLDQQRAGLTATTRDNQLYEELSRLNNELINRERELARKTAALERVVAEKSRLTAIAAHDLRNPLTVIAAYTDLLRIDGTFSGEEALYLEEISRSAKFMMELIEEILEASRRESGHIDLELQKIDLVAAARHAATINRMRADRKQILLTFEPAADRLYIQADAVKLRQIINNLVVNAIKFSNAHTTVTMRVRRADGRAILEVEDQGIGIPRAKLASIFEPFETLGSRGTAGERSTGLGLAIVKQLADLHGAAVEVESEPERGSIFRIAFPTDPP